MCVCACAQHQDNKTGTAARPEGYLLTGNPKLFHWRERETNEKKLFDGICMIYFVCECRRYLRIVGAE